MGFPGGVFSEIILHATIIEFVLFVGVFFVCLVVCFGFILGFSCCVFLLFFFSQGKYTSRLMANSTIKQLKFIKKNF